MNHKLLILLFLSSISFSSYADNCLTPDEVTKAVATDKLVTPTGKCTKPNKPTTPESIDKAFVGSEDTSTYKTNAAMEGYTGFTEGVITQATAPVKEVPLVDNFVSKTVTEAKQTIQQNDEESTTYKTGVALGTAAVIALSFGAVHHRAKKESEEMIKPLKDSNKRLEESNKRLEESSKRLEEAKLEQYRLMEAQRTNTTKATEQGLTTKPYTPFVP